MARMRSTTATKPAAEKVAKPKDKTEPEMMAAAGIVPAEETPEHRIDIVRAIWIDQMRRTRRRLGTLRRTLPRRLAQEAPAAIPAGRS